MRLLYCEPGPNREEPIDDDLTTGMSAALKAGTPGPSYRGWHRCACGARSANHDVILPDGSVTNTLAVHYLRDHRASIPTDELTRVREWLASWTDRRPPARP